MDNDHLHYDLYSPRPSPANYDPSEGPPGSWTRPEHHQAAFQWAPHASGLPQPYPHPIQQVSLPEHFLVHAGGLPPPYIGYHGAPGPDVLSSGFPTRVLYNPPHRLPLPVHNLPPSLGHPGISHGQISDGSPAARSALGDRSSNLLRSLPSPNNPSTTPSNVPAASSQPPQPGPTASTFAAQLPSAHAYPPHPSSSSRRNPFSGTPRYPLEGPHTPTPTPQALAIAQNLLSPSGSALNLPLKCIPSSHPHANMSSPPALSDHSVGLPMTSTGARRTARVRRTATTTPNRTFEASSDEYDELRRLAYDRMSRLAGNLDRQTMEVVINAHVQQLRASRNKQVASKSFIQSLQSVGVDDLPASERHCVICYNDYGVASPEGVKEVPLRLPKCQHVFGDHCLKKWFEEAEHCPYCRDKVESEPKYKPNASRTFVNIMRMRGLQGSQGGSIEASASRTVFGRERSPRAGSNERRSPSEDFEEPPRRIRQRRNHPTREEEDIPHIIAGPPSMPSTPTLVDSHLTASPGNIENQTPVASLPGPMRQTTASRNPLSPSAPNFWPSDYGTRPMPMGMVESVHLSVDMPPRQQQTLPNPLRFTGGASFIGFRNNENIRPPLLPNGEENPDSIEVAP